MKDYLVEKLAMIIKMHGYDYPPARMKYLVLNMNKIYDIEKLAKNK